MRVLSPRTASGTLFRYTRLKCLLLNRMGRSPMNAPQAENVESEAMTHLHLLMAYMSA